MWEALLAMSAYASGLVTLRPMERMPSVPVVVQNAFQKLLKLQSSRDDDHVYSDLPAVAAVRAAYRATVRDCQLEVQPFWLKVALGVGVLMEAVRLLLGDVDLDAAHDPGRGLLVVRVADVAAAGGVLEPPRRLKRDPLVPPGRPAPPSTALQASTVSGDRGSRSRSPRFFEGRRPPPRPYRPPQASQPSRADPTTRHTGPQVATRRSPKRGRVWRRG